MRRQRVHGSLLGSGCWVSGWGPAPPQRPEKVNWRRVASPAAPGICEGISARASGVCCWFWVLTQRSLLTDAELSLKDRERLPNLKHEPHMRMQARGWGWLLCLRWSGHSCSLSSCRALSLVTCWPLILSTDSFPYTASQVMGQTHRPRYFRGCSTCPWLCNKPAQNGEVKSSSRPCSLVLLWVAADPPPPTVVAETPVWGHYVLAGAGAI